MPFTVKFDRISKQVTIAVSIGQKYHSVEAFGEIAQALLELAGKPVKKVVILLGDVLQRYSFEMKGCEKITAYQTSLTEGETWLLGVENILKSLHAAGIETQIVPWFKLILKDPQTAADENLKAEEDKGAKENSIYLDVSSDYVKKIKDEFAKYKNLDPEKEENLNEEFLEWKKFIADLSAEKFSFPNNNDKDVAKLAAGIRKDISTAALNFNIIFQKTLTEEEQIDYNVENGLRLSLLYIKEELVNFMRSPGLKFPKLYYPWSNNPVAQPVTEASKKIKNFIGKYHKEIAIAYPKLANLLEQSKEMEMINFTITDAKNPNHKTMPVSNPSNKTKKEKEGKHKPDNKKETEIPKQIPEQLKEEKVSESGSKKETEIIKPILEQLKKEEVFESDNKKTAATTKSKLVDYLKGISDWEPNKFQKPSAEAAPNAVEPKLAKFDKSYSKSHDNIDSKKGSINTKKASIPEQKNRHISSPPMLTKSKKKAGQDKNIEQPAIVIAPKVLQSPSVSPEKENPPEKKPSDQELKDQLHNSNAIPETATQKKNEKTTAQLIIDSKASFFNSNNLSIPSPSKEEVSAAPPKDEDVMHTLLDTTVKFFRFKMKNGGMPLDKGSIYLTKALNSVFDSEPDNTPSQNFN